MKQFIILSLCALFAFNAAFAQSQPIFPRSQAEDTKGYMSEAYWKIWNAEEQARIDADIEKYRKADGELAMASCTSGHRRFTACAIMWEQVCQ